MSAEVHYHDDPATAYPGKSCEGCLPAFVKAMTADHPWAIAHEGIPGIEPAPMPGAAEAARRPYGDPERPMTDAERAYLREAADRLWEDAGDAELVGGTMAARILKEAATALHDKAR